MAGTGPVWVEQGETSLTFRVRSRRLLLRYAGWSLLLAGMLLLAFADEDLLFLGMLVFLLGAGSDFVEALLTATQNPKGCITPVTRLTIHGAGKARGYRETPERPRLEAAGRSWPLEDVRRIDIGRGVVHNRYGTVETFATYLVLPDCVLQLASSPRRVDAERLAARLRDAIDPELLVDEGRDQEPVSAGLGGVILAAVVGITLILGLVVAVPASWMNKWLAIVCAVTTVLVLRLLVTNVSGDEEKLAEYGLARFGVGSGDESD